MLYFGQNRPTLTKFHIFHDRRWAVYMVPRKGPDRMVEVWIAG